MKKNIFLLLGLGVVLHIIGCKNSDLDTGKLYPNEQKIYLGADNSYINEMEDCGAVYKENNIPVDPFELFAAYKCNLVRARLWHTPSWYDTLNHGKRYCDYADAARTLGRAKQAGMETLLNFHLSDFWADPQRQLVPAAWLPIVNNLPILKDSLYQYIYGTLWKLHQEDLLPHMVQIGNETNKGILLSPEDDEKDALEWSRNAQLFNTGIRAIRDIEQKTGKPIKIALHMAAPEEARTLLQGYLSHGIVDFDVIGISYYWAWHKPTTIPEAVEIVQEMKLSNPDKEVIIFETGYPWTLEHADDASNIINEPHPEYDPPTPIQQLNWLVDLTHAALKHGATGVLYWEPAWVSTPCATPWGKGSHQEHATFFDFDHNLLPEGGMLWFGQDYKASAAAFQMRARLVFNSSKKQILLTTGAPIPDFKYSLFSSEGSLIQSGTLMELPVEGKDTQIFKMDGFKSGRYHIVVQGPDFWIGSLGFEL
jgi:arabinogalactan endo-1,4-beta-galactosidase